MSSYNEKKGNMKIKKENFIKNIVRELEDENVAVFAGAGLSMPAGFVNWETLLKPIAEELDLEVEKESDLITLAQFHCNSNGFNRNKLSQLILDEFSKRVEPTENHRIIARLPIKTYWTTNYDKLIENTLIEHGRMPDVKYTKNHLALTKRNRDCTVFKMHGDVEHPDEAILNKDDYEAYHIKMAPFVSALKGDLVSKTFIFMGFSFTDPNLDYILSRVRLLYDKNQRGHYCFIKRVKIKENENRADFEYRERKQTYFIQDLERFNIKTILLEEYSEITDILREIEARYRRKSIFISGAAQEYSPFEREEAESFIRGLARRLVSKDFRIVSGFGKGVGDAVISGALQEIYMNTHKKSIEQLILRPFPQEVFDGQDKKTIWNKYRKDMLDYSGISIFLFGNRLNYGEVISSGGVREEFEIARAKGLFLLPVGATGYMAEELWKEMNADFDKFNPNCSELIKNKFTLIGDKSKSSTDLIQLIIEIIDEITKY